MPLRYQTKYKSSESTNEKSHPPRPQLLKSFLNCYNFVESFLWKMFCIPMSYISIYALFVRHNSLT